MKPYLHTPQRHFTPHRLARCIAALPFAVLTPAALAQQSPALLPEVVVTSAPLGAAAGAQPASVLVGDALTLKKSTSIAETLDRELGVASTYFGPNAARPVIRGMDGDRIKVLNNSGAAQDVAGLSFDHATPIDPLVIDRLEVLRGPAAMLYGGSAVGGVVNALDNRIPSSKIDALSGTVELRGASASSERSASFVVETPLTADKVWALHVDGFSRSNLSAAVPIALPCVSAVAKRICNTDAQARGGAVGVSRQLSQGYFGVALSTYTSLYGTPAEDEVKIDMKSHRLAVMGEQRGLVGLFSAISGQINATRYTHTELDAGVPATEFKKNGTDGRLELTQQTSPFAWGKLSGTTGLSFERSVFSAIGDEAFVPENTTQHTALFTAQSLATRWGALSLGGRIEQVKVNSKGGAQTDYLGNAKFTAANRSFTPTSLALGTVVKINDAWQWTANLSRNERAPAGYELYANGAHIATGAYEIGDVNLSKERSRNVDFALKWGANGHSASLGGFYNRFSNYINLANTGSLIGEDGDPAGTDLTLYRYAPVAARFMGLEAQGAYKVSAAWRFDAKLDILRANDTTSGEALPRISPARLTLAAHYAANQWQTKLEWALNAAQKRVPAFDLLGATASYNVVNLSLGYRQKSSWDALWFLRLDNATNRLGYNATTIDTVRGKSPIVGRNLKIGVQLAF